MKYVLGNTLATAVAVLMGWGAAAAEPLPDRTSDTSVLKWRDGKRAVFLLAFDDSCRSHVRNAIPELARRGLVGTFYINPANGPFQSERAAWEQQLPGNPAVVYGNHTFSHVGATNAAQLDVELTMCGEVIRSCTPGRPWPRLVSFGRPGGVPWKVSDEEKAQLLAKHHLVERPPFFGFPMSVKTREAVCGLVDAALAKGDMGHLDFHGVGGDWLVTPADVFAALLDKLEACRGEVWVTDHVTYHKYLTERASARVEVVQAGPERIRLRLACAANPALYDAALTLETRVPADWAACRVTQGGERAEIKPVRGAVRYAALPGRGEIVLERL